MWDQKPVWEPMQGKAFEMVNTAYLSRIMFVNGRRATKEKPGEARRKNTLLYLKIFKDVRMFMC